VLICLAGILLIVAVGISSTKPAGNGPVVSAASALARALSSAAGVFAMFFCFMLMLNSVIKIARPGEAVPRFVWGLWAILLFASSLYHAIQIPWESAFQSAKTGGGGGLIGASVSWFLHVAVTRPGSMAVMVLGLIVGGSLVLGKSPWAPFAFAWMVAMNLWQWFRDLLGEVFKAHGPSPEDLETEAEEAGEGSGKEEEEAGLDQLLDSEGESRGAGQRRGAAAGSRYEAAASSSFSSTVAELRAKLAQRDAESGGAAGQQGQPAQPDQHGRPGYAASGAAGRVGPGSLDADQLAEEFRTLMEQPPLSEELFYEYPPLDLLPKSEPPKRAPRGKEDIDGLSRVIEKTLLSFGVIAKVIGIEQGPTVTRFELQPGPGVKVASIVNLSQDLALALAAQDVRIEAPIPGKSAVGIEVPNKEISLVHLRDVLETKEFRNSKSALTIALGKDVSGRPVVANLDYCLHLLIAGATGAGKSVCINSIISSLLYKARPDEVKLVLIDPKRVELSAWSRIPHLIAPVVSDPKKAAGALRWAIKEMEARYEKFTRVGARDIDGYNQVATPPDSVKPAMPYIVIIIDELSDLMVVAPAEVEDAVFRLAQMARASGIYLVVATQRPSVDVLTGTIKANIPSRIAFAVASQVDSRTILDIAGAEKLLGRGDMLFSPVGSTKPIRAQGCYVSEREIDELVSFVSSQARPQFAPGILSVPETMERNTEVQDDPFFPQALRIVVEAKQASVSLLQRKLPIGYSRAARLIDAMEVRGYVGPYGGSKPREVRITIQEYMRLFEGGGIGAHGQGPQADGGPPVPRDTDGPTRRNPYDQSDR
jgi:S-DNA-T family DNA segregation ATPase FtsK/SpoIIIE